MQEKQLASVLSPSITYGGIQQPDLGGGALTTIEDTDKYDLLRKSERIRVATMKPRNTEPTNYRIKEVYRKQPFGGVINQDPATLSWSWKGHIDLEDGPYSQFSSRRRFTTGLEAEDHMRRFAHERIDNWLKTTQPGSI